MIEGIARDSAADKRSSPYCCNSGKPASSDLHGGRRVLLRRELELVRRELELVRRALLRRALLRRKLPSLYIN